MINMFVMMFVLLMFVFVMVFVVRFVNALARSESHKNVLPQPLFGLAQGL